MISGHGPENAKILLIDDIPTREDYQTGKAISGTGESSLNSLFQNYNYRVRDTYRTLFCKEAVEYNGDDKKKREASFQAAFSKHPHEQIFKEELKGVVPNIIVPLGERSLQFLTGMKSIHKYRGSILPLRSDFQEFLGPKVKVIPTFGPQLLNQNYTSRAYVAIDIGKVIKYKDFEYEVKPDGYLWIAKSVEDFNNYLTRCDWTDSNYAVFDIETQFGIPTCIAFALSNNEAVCVPLQDPTMDAANLVCLWQKVAQVLNHKIRKINQNIKYDVTILERFRFNVSNVTGDDTVLRAGLIYPELPKNLGFLTSVYTEMPYHKDEGKDFDIKHREKYYLYCAKDALATRRVFEGQEAEIQEFGLTDLNEKTKKLFHIYKKMDERGILVDDSVRQELIAKYKTLLDIHKSCICQLANKADFNVRSFPQVTELVYNQLRYPKRASYDEDTIEELASFDCKFEEGPAILREIIIVRKLYKILEYLMTTMHPDFRWRANYNLSGTKTGRTACNSSIDRMFELSSGIVTMSDAGRSLQTITKHGFRIGDEVIGTDVRKMFVPTPGYILVEADLSQAEARVDAVLSMDYNLLPLFDNPGIHKITGSWLYNCKPEDIKKGTLEYHLSKIFRHAGERNIQAKTLSMTTHKPIRYCEEILAKFHKYQPNIKEVFHREVMSFVRKNRVLVSPNGRRRDFFGRPDYQMDNDAISYIPQAVVGDQNKFSFIPIKEALPSVIYLNEAHDSSLVEIKREELEIYGKLVKEHIEKPISFREGSIRRDFDLVIPSDISWTDTCWYEPEMKRLEI